MEAVPDLKTPPQDSPPVPERVHKGSENLLRGFKDEEHQRKAQEAAKAAQAGLTPEDKARRVIARNADKLAQVLVDVALGAGDLDDGEKDRATFAMKALEFGIGKPRTAPPAKPSEPEEEPEPAGLAFE